MAKGYVAAMYTDAVIADLSLVHAPQLQTVVPEQYILQWRQFPFSIARGRISVSAGLETLSRTAVLACALEKQTRASHLQLRKGQVCSTLATAIRPQFAFPVCFLRCRFQVHL